MHALPTFQRQIGTTSTIDYIYLGRTLKNQNTGAPIQYKQSKWSDHALLQTQWNVGTSKMGPGLWRGYPAYASNPQFQALLSAKIERLLIDTITNDAQLMWEKIKVTTYQCIKSFEIKHDFWRTSSLKLLECKRNRLLRSKPPLATILLLLPKIDEMIETIQQELVDTPALKSGLVWREKGERSAKYLKAIHQTQTAQQYMPGIRSSPSNNVSSTDSSNLTVITPFRTI